MTALVLENLTALSALVQSARVLLKGLGRRLDNSVSALAARSVPEARMQEVQSEIARYHALVRKAAARQ